ncbi:MAG: hypothetical protein U9R16_01630, partial [Campylobacterota bacterium]|nr:hypothetical protein [Campylobacterota bacterium]
KNNYINQLESVDKIMIKDTYVDINILDINIKNNIVQLDIETISSKSLTYSDMEYIKVNLEKKIDNNIILKITPKIILE